MSESVYLRGAWGAEFSPGAGLLSKIISNQTCHSAASDWLEPSPSDTFPVFSRRLPFELEISHSVNKRNFLPSSNTYTFVLLPLLSEFSYIMLSP